MTSHELIENDAPVGEVVHLGHPEGVQSVAEEFQVQWPSVGSPYPLWHMFHPLGMLGV